MVATDQCTLNMQKCVADTGGFHVLKQGQTDHLGTRALPEGPGSGGPHEQLSLPLEVPTAYHAE